MPGKPGARPTGWVCGAGLCQAEDFLPVPMAGILPLYLHSARLTFLFSFPATKLTSGATLSLFL